MAKALLQPDDYITQIRMPNELAERLRERAVLEDRSMAACIRRAIQQYLDREPAAA